MKITMKQAGAGLSIKGAFEDFVVSQMAKGVYTDIQLKTFIHGMEVFNMKIIMRRDSVILSKSRNRLRQRRNLSD